MKVRRVLITVALLAMAAPSAWAVYPSGRTLPPSSRASARPSITPNPRAVLRQARHEQRLARVEGIVRGMTNKLDNLSQRLTNQLAGVERRLEVLRSAGHTLTVDTELTALRQAVATAQERITAVKEALAALPDTDTPRQHAAEVHELVRSLRTQLVAVRDAFHALRLAIRDDLRASLQPSTTPTP